MRILAPSAAGHAGALQNAVNTAKNCCAEFWAVVLSVLLLLRLARALRGPCFFPVGFRAFSRAQPQNAAVYCVLLHLRFRAGLRAALFGLCFWASGARAHDPMSAFWVGARLGTRKLESPASSGAGVGNMHNLTSHISTGYVSL